MSPEPSLYPPDPPRYGTCDNCGKQVDQYFDHVLITLPNMGERWCEGCVDEGAMEAKNTAHDALDRYIQSGTPDDYHELCAAAALAHERVR